MNQKTLTAIALIFSLDGNLGLDMNFDDYLREEAEKYRRLAETTEDQVIKQELLELATICDEVANNIEDRMMAG